MQYVENLYSIRPAVIKLDTDRLDWMQAASSDACAGLEKPDPLKIRGRRSTAISEPVRPPRCTSSPSERSYYSGFRKKSGLKQDQSHARLTLHAASSLKAQ